jgi:hypothetical protein
MKLSNGGQASIDPRKITEYCLSTSHEDGRHKARLFASVLGLTIGHADQLLEALRDAAVGKHDQYGQRFSVDFDLTGPAGVATIRSCWIIPPGESVPRLVTCYIL